MGKTVTTYLLDSDPKGTRYVFISNKICQMYVIPRSQIQVVNNRAVLQTPALYILLGETEEAEPKAYIGQTENFSKRVKNHESRKAFWDRALVFVSRDATMTKADVQYLEHMAIEVASKASSFILDENKQIPKEPNLPEYRKDDMNEFFYDITFLVSFIGCSIFETIELEKEEQKLYHLNSRGCNASGFLSAGGFTVIKGSIITDSSAQSYPSPDKRSILIKEYTNKQGENLVLASDVTFNSPSTAANFCNGMNNNGWTSWKDKDGNTLDNIERNKE